MDRWGLVGRERELTVLADARRRAAAGRGLVVAVTGDAGIGKSRVLDALAHDAAADGAVVAWGRAWEAGGAPPMLPWREVVRDLGLAWPDVDEADDYSQFRLFDAVASLLGAAGPVTVLLDDLHAADEGTNQFLRFLAGRVASTRLLVVAAWREVEARLAGAALADVRPELTVRLRPLDRDGVAALLAHVQGEPVDDATAAQVYETSGGNPLHAKEAFGVVVAGGTADTVRRIAERRLDVVGDAARQLVLTAAVAGREFDAAVVAAASGVVDPGAWGDVVATGLVEPSGAGRYRFCHMLVRDGIASSLDAADRARRHVALAKTLEAEPGTPASVLARHYEQAVAVVGAEVAADAAARAGDEAAAALAFGDAVVHFSTALSLHGTRADPALRTGLLLRRGECRVRIVDLHGARADFREAAALARRVDRSDLLGRAALGLASTAGAGVVYGATGISDPEGVQQLRESLAVQPPGDHPLRVELAARLATELWADFGAVDERRALVADALATADRIGDPRLRARARLAEFFTGMFEHAPDHVLRLGEDVAALAEQVDDLGVIAGAGLTSFMLCMAQGDIAGARQAAAKHRAFAQRYGIPVERWRAMTMATALELATGDIDKAAAMIEEGHAVGMSAGPTSTVEIVYLTQVAMISRRRGTIESITGLRENLLAAAEAAPGITTLRAGAALCDMWLGRHDDARAEARHALDVAMRFTADLNWLATLSLVGEVLAEIGEPAECAQVRRLLAPWSGWMQLIGTGIDIVGPVDRALACLAAAAGEWDEADRLFAAALEQDHRAGAWGSHMLTLRAQATFLDRRGDTRGAGEALARMRADAARRGVHGFGEFTVAPAAVVATARTAALMRKPTGWAVSYGGRDVEVRSGRGFDALAALLAAPGREVHVLDLADAAVDQAPLGPALDESARRKYRARAEELADELAEAEANNDIGRISAIREELELIAAELSGAEGRGGRARPVGSTAERARVTVTKALRAAIARIGEHHPELGGHLDAAVRTGLYCRYDPDPTAPVEWTITL